MNETFSNVHSEPKQVDVSSVDNKGFVDPNVPRTSVNLNDFSPSTGNFPRSRRQTTETNLAISSAENEREILIRLFSFE